MSGFVAGRMTSFFKASLLLVAAAAAHHATLLFGSVFFAVPVVVLVFLDGEKEEGVCASGFVGRLVAIVLVVAAAIAVVLLPFWLSRSFTIQSRKRRFRTPVAPKLHPEPAVGLDHFVIPYGALILALPFIFIRLCGDSTAPAPPRVLGRVPLGARWNYSSAICF